MNDMSRAPPFGGSPRTELQQFAAVSTIFDAAEIVLYVADMQTYELLFFNKHAEQLWGRKIGEPCYKVLQVGQSGPCEFCTNPRLVDNAHPVVWEFQNTANKRWYLCIDKAIPWGDGRLVRMEVAIDITERKAHELFREHYIDLISHDLRNPLATIDVALSVLTPLLEQAGVAAAPGPVEAIGRSTKRMANMIDDLLETTHLESGQLELHTKSFDLARLAETIVGQLRATVSRAVRVEARSPAPVHADEGRIERVFENLVGNAFRYSPADSPVCVCIETDEREAIVTIADHGIGIAADELPKLFQRFYRAAGNAVPKGFGLGLYNSRLIVERHGGRIWAESSSGAGSRFRFSLPLARVP